MFTVVAEKADPVLTNSLPAPCDPVTSDKSNKLAAVILASALLFVK